MGHVTPKKVGSASTYRHPPLETTHRHQAKHDQSFVDACEAKGVAPTGRQFSKWKRGFGKARGLSRSGKRIDPTGTPTCK